jgi:hypothetical protein
MLSFIFLKYFYSISICALFLFLFFIVATTTLFVIFPFLPHSSLSFSQILPTLLLDEANGQQWHGVLPALLLPPKLPAPNAADATRS